jgi:DNA-binding transcriptional LysR family regulator
MSTLRWDDLKTFLAVARGGSMTVGARALGVNITTAYRRLDALEKQLGAQLFTRRGGQYALTAVGRDALDHARQVEEDVLALQREVSGHDRQASGPVAVTMPESLLPWVTPILVDFRREHPRIEPQLELGDRMFDLDRREADVAIRPSRTPPDHVVGRHIAPLAWTVYGPRDANPTDELPWLSYTDALSAVAATSWRRRHHPSAEVVLSVSSVPAMQQLLGATRARGMLPCFVGDTDERLARLIEPHPDMASALWLLVHADLRRSARVRAFVDFAYPRLMQLAPLLSGAQPT